MRAKPKQRRRRSIADRVCAAVEDLTADRSSHTYAAQWVMVHDVARYLRVRDDEVLVAIEEAGGRLKCDSDHPHSVSLFAGWTEP